MVEKNSESDMGASESDVEIKDDDVVVILRKDSEDSVKVFTCFDLDSLHNTDYAKLSYTGVMMTALPSFLSSSETNKQLYMKHVWEHHPELLELFLTLDLKDL